MTIDVKGEFRTFAKDEKGTRILVVYNNKKPGKRRYRLYRIDHDEQKIDCELKNKPFVTLDENELKNRFGEKQQSVLEVFREKGNPGQVDIARLKGTRLRTGGGRIKLPKDRRIRSTVTSSAPRQLQEGTVASGVPYVPPVTRKAGKSNTKNESDSKIKTSIEAGVIAAKRALELRKSSGGGMKKRKFTPSLNSKDKKGKRGERNASGRKKQKSFMWKVAKIYAAGLGGAFGVSGIVSLLT